MKKMILMAALILGVGMASTSLVGCSKETKATGTTTKKDGETGSTEKKETKAADPAPPK